ncbi:hypothetical protein BX070DRAFT_234671 [Coemansia spiralis]|nr:hypothetical protein BX070DRAFT_234671 [Coemansia spiralis]
MYPDHTRRNHPVSECSTSSSHSSHSSHSLHGQFVPGDPGGFIMPQPPTNCYGEMSMSMDCGPYPLGFVLPSHMPRQAIEHRHHQATAPSRPHASLVNQQPSSRPHTSFAGQQPSSRPHVSFADQQPSSRPRHVAFDTRSSQPAFDASLSQPAFDARSSWTTHSSQPVFDPRSSQATYSTPVAYTQHYQDQAAAYPSKSPPPYTAHDMLDARQMQSRASTSQSTLLATQSYVSSGAGPQPSQYAEYKRKQHMARVAAAPAYRWDDIRYSSQR